MRPRARRSGAAGSLNANILRLLQRLEGAGFAEYMDLARRPGRMMWLSFLAGLSRGVGFFLGASVMGAVMLALVSWSLYRLLDVAHYVPALNELVHVVRGLLKDFLAKHAGGS